MIFSFKLSGFKAILPCFVLGCMGCRNKIFWHYVVFASTVNKLHVMLYPELRVDMGVYR